MSKPLTIFVHRASECLTDHESHGDGLICFSLLNGLAERGHKIFAFTNRAAIGICSPNLRVQTSRHRIPANSLAHWEYGWRADRWMADLAKRYDFNLVWRMHPYHGGCPTEPNTMGKPLVVGPLFYPWPENNLTAPKEGKPRFGFGIQGLVAPSADRGWAKTLQKASLIICATSNHAKAMQKENPFSTVMDLPVIVGQVDTSGRLIERPCKDGLKLAFIANLLPYKNPMVFCKIVEELLSLKVNVSGVVLGDGPERARLGKYTALHELPIEFLGKVSNADVYLHLTNTDFLVSCSVGEPYGRGIAEAMAVGTPCICHRSGGPADYILDGFNGLLVDELSPDQFAIKLNSAVSQPGQWSWLSDHARDTAESWRSDVVLDKLEAQLYAAAKARRSERASV